MFVSPRVFPQTFRRLVESPQFKFASNDHLFEFNRDVTRDLTRFPLLLAGVRSTRRIIQLRKMRGSWDSAMDASVPLVDRSLQFVEDACREGRVQEDARKHLADEWQSMIRQGNTVATGLWKAINNATTASCQQLLEALIQGVHPTKDNLAESYDDGITREYVSKVILNQLCEFHHMLVGDASVGRLATSDLPLSPQRRQWAESERFHILSEFWNDLQSLREFADSGWRFYDAVPESWMPRLWQSEPPPWPEPGQRG